MRIQKIYYNAIVYDNNLTEKARDDSFDPTTIPSGKYKTWHAVLDLRTCPVCRSNNGKVYLSNDITDKRPPVHPNCRCEIQDLKAIMAGNATKNGKEGADYWLRNYNSLPDYYISYQQLNELGWRYGDRPSKYAPGKMLGRSIYDNIDGHLPRKVGRIWYEADINYTQGRRNLHRIVWSNDGLIFVTYDHFKTFYEII